LLIDGANATGSAAPGLKSNDQGQPHALTADEVAVALGVEITRGLSRPQVTQRLGQYGPNLVQMAARPRFWRLVLRQLQSLLIVILLVAASVSLLVGDAQDTAVILVVVIFNALIGALQEARAERALAALQAMSAPTARVLRAGDVGELPASDLVPGDVVLVHAGDLVPADGRLLEGASLQVDESPLTGESAPVDKEFSRVLPVETALADRVNMIFAGSAVTYGHGRLIVSATGSHTELGHLAAAVSSARPQPTPLERQVAWLGKVLSLLALGASAAVFVLGLLHGQPLGEMFMVGLTLAVAAVPEGLPAVVTIVLALGVQRMATRRAIVRRLSAVEALGATTVICSDKTGTLTLGEMRVVTLLAGGHRLEVDGGELREAGQRVEPAAVPGLPALLRVAVLANNARLGPTPTGDPTERALLYLSATLGVDHLAEATARPRLDELPFSSDRKRMATLHRDADRLVAYVKGAPDHLLARCARVVDDAGEHQLGAQELAQLEATVNSLAARGLRLLALAERPLDWALLHSGASERADLIERDLTLLGVVGLLDPPRPEVPAALADCHQASVRVVMMTGDHPATATAIAAQLGIGDGTVLTGPELERLDDAALQRAAAATAVYARVVPHQKMQIIQALQAQGEIAAMTGDGANDAPALRLADIGVAMGIRGTAVAKDAAAMVLADDNFATIVAAVEEGRAIYANLRKTVLYLLSGNLGEVLVLFLAMLFGLPLPLLPIQILWINLFTDALPALGLGLEPREPGIMTRPPRAPGEPFLPRWTAPLIIVPSVLLAAVTLVAFEVSLTRFPEDLALAQTTAFVTLALAHLGIGWAQRSSLVSSFHLPLTSNPVLLLSFAAAFVPLLMMLYTAPGQLVAHGQPLDLAAWLLTISLVPLPLLGAEGSKAMLRQSSGLPQGRRT
jgi:Ca2+-transporting ATPase